MTSARDTSSGPSSAVALSRRILLGASLGVMLAASPVASSAWAQTPIKFTLDWKFEGASAPFVYTLDKGYFKAEGLDVTIDTGSGSVEPLNRVGSGSYDMGFGDINSLIKFVDKNANSPVKAVFMLYNSPPFAIIGRKSKGITTPKDLEGKTLGAPAADGAYAQWPIFVKTAGIDASKVKIQNVGFPVREPMLVKGEVDAIAGFTFSSYLGVKNNVTPSDDVTLMMMSDYGVKLYSNAIIVSPKFAAEKPEAVKGFLRAFLKGLKETIASPETALVSVMKRNEVAKKETEMERLMFAIDKHIVTDEVKKNGLGGVDNARMAEAIDQIAMTFDFTAKPKAEAVFDSSFLPPAADRKL